MPNIIINGCYTTTALYTNILFDYRALPSGSPPLGFLSRDPTKLITDPNNATAPKRRALLRIRKNACRFESQEIYGKYVEEIYMAICNPGNLLACHHFEYNECDPCNPLMLGSWALTMHCWNLQYKAQPSQI